MSRTRSPAQRKRTASLWCGGIALGGAGIPVALYVLILLTTDGRSQMAAIGPAILLFVTWWIWLILAVVALVQARGAEPRTAPYVVGVLALVAAVLGILVCFGML